MEIARLNAVNELYFADFVDDEEKKMDITLTGPVIVGTFTYSMVIEMPRMQIDDCEFPDAEAIPAKITLRPVVADSAPTGMTVTDPITCTIINTRATSLLV
jgi:hypothetical protein